MVEVLLFEIVIILALILANGFFAASEIAVVSARRGRLEQKVQAGSRGAATALELAENPNRFLSTVQVGITLIGTFAAAFGGASIAEILEDRLMTIPQLARYASSVALGIVVLAITYFSLILGELVPKRLALQNAEGIASFVAPIMRQIAQVGAPVVSFLTASTELVLRLLRRHNIPESPITEDDIIALVREGAEGGTVEAAEEDFITSVFTFSDRTVRSLMTPRQQIVAVEISTSLAEVLQIIRESGYSRIPVYEETLDHLLGVLHVKDLVRLWGQSETVNLQALLRPAFYITENQRAVVALQQLKQSSRAIAMVFDEYGQVAGLITLEDLIEELVGDIAGEVASDAIQQRSDGSYLVDGILPYGELQEQLPIPGLTELAHRYNFETVAGLILVLLKYIPKAGATATWQGYTFEVVDMDGQRIDKVLITPPNLSPKLQTEGLLASRAVLPPPESNTRKSGESF